MAFFSKTMNINFKDALGYLTFKDFENINFINHAFSTRLGGVSRNEFASMNLGFGRGDKEENVTENYHLFCKAADFEYESLVASSQDHHTNIRVVDEKDKGIGIYREKDMESIDGLVTNVPKVTLVTYFADCVPIFFVDPVLKVIGLAHCGWRGTADRMAEKMVCKLKSHYGCNPKNILAAIGPSIGPCCFEVDKTVADEFFKLKDLNPESFIKNRPVPEPLSEQIFEHNFLQNTEDDCGNALCLAKKDDKVMRKIAKKVPLMGFRDRSNKDNKKYSVDLWEVNRRTLIASGIDNKNITVTDICTSCNSGLLFSHRITGEKRGSLVSMLAIK